jgi:hypothetical protein
LQKAQKHDFLLDNITTVCQKGRLFSILTFMDIQNLVLRPNCLLTKAPLVFLTGPRSLFFYSRLGAELQDYLAAHGYQVVNVPLPFRSQTNRQFALTRWYEQQSGNNGQHFILGPETYFEFKTQLDQIPNSSLTIISKQFIAPKIPAWRIPMMYRLHQWFCQFYRIKPERYENTLSVSDSQVYDRFLDHCVELAEDEVLGADQ